MPTGPKVLSLTLFAPYSGIPHAGGEYVYRHYRYLAKISSLHVFAPHSNDNADASRNVDDRQYKLSVFGCDDSKWFGIRGAWLLLVKFIRGVSLGLDVERGARRCVEMNVAAKSAEVIEFQWTESASLSRYFRRIAPQARQTLIAHDVLSQRWRRRFKSEKSTAARIFYFGRYVFTVLAERRRFASVDTILVFSDKDAGLVRNLYRSADVRVVSPPLMEDGMLEARSQASSKNSRCILFTGAMSRPENDEGIRWFADEIWRDVKAEIPDCRLVIAGAGPSPELLNFSETHHDVLVTGRVDDLAPFYRDADVFISPMFNGAGVKFKNIIAMLWGLPILSTAIGAEGIGSEDLYLAVTDDRNVFRETLLRALRNRDIRHGVAAKAKAWAFATYGDEQFAKQLQDIYLAPAGEGRSHS